MGRRLRTCIQSDWDQYHITHTVPYCDVDAMGVVWHGNYLRYAEMVRQAYFEHRGLGYQTMADHGWAAPVVRFEMEFRAPARSGDAITIHIACKPSDRCAVDLVYEIHDGDGNLLWLAHSTQAFWDADGQVFLSRPPIVEAFFKRIALGEAEDEPGFAPQGDAAFAFIETTEQSEEHITGIFSWPDSLPVFDGHFPNNPIVPGVYQLAAGHVLAERIQKGSLQLTATKKAKFMNPVIPRQRCEFTLKIKETAPGNWQGKLQGKRDGDKICSATLEFTANTTGSINDN